MFSSCTLYFVQFNQDLEVYGRNSGVHRWVMREMKVTTNPSSVIRNHFQEKLQRLDHSFRGKTNSQEKDNLREGDTCKWQRHSLTGVSRAEYNTPTKLQKDKGKANKIKREQHLVDMLEAKYCFPTVRSQLAQHVFESEAQSALLWLIKTFWALSSKF